MNPPHPAMTAGRTAVITGAASGIGRAAAFALGGLGMNLALVDHDEEALARTCAEAARVLARGAEIMPLPCDVADEAALASVKAQVDARMPDVGVLMNNAGTAPGGGPLGPVEGWRRVLGVNLFGVLHGLAAFAPDMIAQGTPGCVINTGSKQGITAPPGDTAYNASKAGVKVLTEGLAHALRTDGSKVTAHLLIPGFVWTGMTSRNRGGPDPEARPKGAWTPEETVAFMLRRLGENAFYILCPDGETTAQMDRGRILWAAGDIIEDRPALSRWDKGYESAFKAFMEKMPPG